MHDRYDDRERMWRQNDEEERRRRNRDDDFERGRYGSRAYDRGRYEGGGYSGYSSNDRDRFERERYGEDRNRYGSRRYSDDYYRGRDDEREDRGLLERAGDEIRSWFSDEDSERHNRGNYERGNYEREGHRFSNREQRGRGTGDTWTYTESWLVLGPYSGRGPKGYKRSDDRIMEDVCERLTQHGQLDASDIQVQVNDGEVTLSGHVPDRRSKRLAEDLLDNVSGVKDVHNQLRAKQDDGNLFGKSQNDENMQQQKIEKGQTAKTR